MFCFTEHLLILHTKDLMKMIIENEHLNCVQPVSYKLTNENNDHRKLAGTLGIQGLEGYRGIRKHWGLLGGVGAIWGHQGVSGV